MKVICLYLRGSSSREYRAHLSPVEKTGPLQPRAPQTLSIILAVWFWVLPPAGGAGRESVSAEVLAAALQAAALLVVVVMAVRRGWGGGSQRETLFVLTENLIVSAQEVGGRALGVAE